MSNGKGSKPRPRFISLDEWIKNWYIAFNEKQKKGDSYEEVVKNITDGGGVGSSIPCESGEK